MGTYDTNNMAWNKEPFSLYLHIPFCVSKCPYCDFNVHVVPKIPEREYSETLLQELAAYAETEDWRRRKLKSIYFGGGTPSTFSPLSIGKILEKTEDLFPFAEYIEISLEANPGTDDGANFFGYRSCGINRISIGAQSFQPHLLKFLGRLHSAEETREALRMVRKAGFENFSLDLIYASPGQSLTDLRADLEEALGFQPPHLSAYNLTIEEGTPFHRDFRSGRIRPLSEEEEVAMAELIEETLSRAGLERYEISNYARPGYQSRHNTNYWSAGDYLGIGAGAHSYKRDHDNSIFGHRWHNEKNPGRYMEKVEKEGDGVAQREEADLRQAAAEFMFMGLRMVRGISIDEFIKRFGSKPDEFYPQISDWLQDGLMESIGDRIRLTHRGFFVANSIFVHFI